MNTLKDNAGTVDTGTIPLPPLVNSLQKPRTDRRFAATNGREKTSWEVSEIWDLHHQIKRRIFLGQKNVDIARALGCTKEQVSSVRNSPVIREELQKMHESADAEVLDIRAEIKELAPDAMKVLEELMVNPDTPANVRLGCCRDVLDRDGHQAVQQVNHLHGHFTANDLLEIKDRAKQIGVSQGIIAEPGADDVIDAEILDSALTGTMVKNLPEGANGNDGDV